MAAVAFVPPGFEPPPHLATDRFVLEPLGPAYNEADYEAWSSSVEHIRSTPGFEGRSWPSPLSLAENRIDLELHARHFADRTGFTYTVLDAVGGEVVGCVYIYPADPGAVHDASARSWVRASRAELDAPLWRAVSDWLAAEWPFRRVEYAPRP